MVERLVHVKIIEEHGTICVEVVSIDIQQIHITDQPTGGPKNQIQMIVDMVVKKSVLKTI